MDRRIRLTINEWKRAFGEHFKVSAEEQEKLDALFDDIEKVGEECENDDIFEMEVADTELGQRYMDLAAEIAIDDDERVAAREAARKKKLRQRRRQQKIQEQQKLREQHEQKKRQQRKKRRQQQLQRRQFQKSRTVRRKILSRKKSGSGPK